MLSPPAASSPASPTTVAADSANAPVLADVLDRLGLTQYLGVLVDNGFGTWDTVLDITEEDLTKLRFKLGHRRALQREIATFRGVPTYYALELDGSPNPTSTTPTPAPESLSGHNTSTGREKRRYRRHPRPDHNAPKKPKTAYVNFADHLRTDPAINSLSFVDIAKEVGRRWQNLPAEKKRMWESKAARAMHEYEVQMDDYKKTDPYRKYQLYLEEFKAQQSQANKSGNRASPGMLTRNLPSYGSSSSSDSPVSHPSSLGADAEAWHNALTLAFSELVSVRGEVFNSATPPYNEKYLPPEDLTRRAMYAFLQGTGSLLYMWTYPQVDEILDRIYRPEKPVDPMTLAECFTVAAIGAHCDVETFPIHQRQVLFASGTVYFNEQTARMDYLRATRLLLSMSFYALLERDTGARYFVAAGLQISRRIHPLPNRPSIESASDIWKKLVRSLIVVDCWLSCTSDYTSEISVDDISFACSPGSDAGTLEDALQTQSVQIALITAAIDRAVVSPQSLAAHRETVTLFQQKLNTWRLELPHVMQLPTLVSSQSCNLAPSARSAAVMLHVMHLGSLMLLYRQPLLAAADAQLNAPGDAGPLELFPDEIEGCRTECAVIAQLIARVLGQTNPAAQQCWLTMYSAFTACYVLLFSAMTKLLDCSTDGAGENLNHSKDCLDILETCCSHEVMANNGMAVMRPLYDRLRDVHQRTVGRVKTSIFSLLQPTDSNQLSPRVPFSKGEMQPIVSKLAEILTDPFGRKQVAQDGA